MRDPREPEPEGAQRGAEQGYGADCLQRLLVPRFRFQQQLMPGGWVF
jgi:hypothetical protein